MKSLIPLAFFVCGAIAVCVFFTFGKHCLGLGAEDLSALFTGIGLAGIVATLIHQRYESEEQNVKHANLLKALEKQTDAGYRSAEAACVAGELAVMDSLISNLDRNVDQDRCVARRQVLIDRLGQLNPNVR